MITLQLYITATQNKMLNVKIVCYTLESYKEILYYISSYIALKYI